MKGNKKILISVLAIFAIVLTSCEESCPVLNTLADNPFTKWSCEEIKTTLFCQGLGVPRKGAAIVGDEKCEFEIPNLYYDGEALFVDREAKSSCYIINKGSNKKFFATDIETDIKYTFTSKRLSIDEIDLRYFNNTDFINEAKNHSFYYIPTPQIDGAYRWHYRGSKQNITLCFKENKAFEIYAKDDSIEACYGTYNANFKSVVLNFENPNGLFGDTILEFYYNESL
jgi:hypothetical protein